MLTETQEIKLARIKGRSTRYEAYIEVGGRRMLLCYCARSLSQARRYLSAEPTRSEITSRFGDGWLVGFTGRTQREAIIAGELPWWKAEK